MKRPGTEAGRVGESATCVGDRINRRGLLRLVRFGLPVTKSESGFTQNVTVKLLTAPRLRAGFIMADASGPAAGELYGFSEKSKDFPTPTTPDPIAP